MQARSASRNGSGSVRRVSKRVKVMLLEFAASLLQCIEALAAPNCGTPVIQCTDSGKYDDHKELQDRTNCQYGNLTAEIIGND